SGVRVARWAVFADVAGAAVARGADVGAAILAGGHAGSQSRSPAGLAARGVVSPSLESTPAQQSGGPGVAHAKTHQQNHRMIADPPFTGGVLQRNGNRRGDGVAAMAHGYGKLLVGDSNPAAQMLEHVSIGLMKDEQVYVVHGH